MISTTLFIAAALISSPDRVLADFDGSRFAWYSSDAANKFENALPIGNGRLGAMVFGGNTEKVVLNENSMWSGPWQDRVNKNARGAAEDIWKKLLAGSITAAGQSAMSNLAGDPTSPRAYQPLVNLVADFGHSSLGTNYTRWLDTYEGTTGVNYTLNGVTYTREYVASYPHGVLAFRFSSTTPGKLGIKLSLSREKSVAAQTANAARSGSSVASVVTLNANSGQSSGAINFWSEARIVNTGGTVTSDGKTVSITGANAVDVFFNAETSYRYPDASQAQAELKRKLEAAVTAGFPSVRAAAVQDFTNLISRTKLDLGSSGSAGTLPIPTRLSNFRKNPDADPQLVTLMFNFGRHALVSSSRDTGPRSLPANLQGLWNQDYSPPWQSKYTININLEMNYWPALITNLAETQKPVWDLIAMATPRAQVVAKAMYNCDGIVLHHNTDLWGDAAPVDKGTPYTIWPMGAAWLSHDMMEHYHFTLNTTLLRTTIFPTLVQTARFFFCHLREWNGYWTVGPSLSPEHAFIVPSGTSLTQANKAEGIDMSIEMDNQLLRQLFSNILTACTALQSADTTCSLAATYLPKIRPPGISSRTGRIMEWRTDYSEQEPAHRHFSPLFGLYPAAQLTPIVNATLSGAAKRLVDHRLSSGSGSTGWSRAWAVALYARLGEGDTAYKHVQEFIKKYPTGNMFGSDGGTGTAFQIDGNFGLTAGLAEMLVQSHGGNGRVHLLPAVPGKWAKGRVEGLMARGGFLVDVQWEGGEVRGVVTSREGSLLELRVGSGKQQVKVDGKVYEGPVETVKGMRYEVTAKLA